MACCKAEIRAGPVSGSSFYPTRSRYMGKLAQLMLYTLATVLIAVGIAAQTGTVHMPG